MVFSEHSHYSDFYPDIACTTSTIGLYSLILRLMGVLPVTNYISVRHYFLAVEISLLLCYSLTYLPCFSATLKVGERV